MSRLAILISPNRNICIWTKTKVYRGDRVVMFTSSVSNAVNKYTHALVNIASNSTSHSTSHSTAQTTSQPKPNIYIPEHISSKITSYLIPTINYEQNSPLNMVFHQNTLLYTIYKNYITTQRQNKKMTILDEVRTRYGRVTKEPERFENITYLSGGTNMPVRTNMTADMPTTIAATGKRNLLRQQYRNQHFILQHKQRFYC